MKTLVLPLEPVPCPRPKLARGGRAYYPARYSRFKAAAAKLMPGCLFDAGIRRPLRGPLMVVVILKVGRPRVTKLRYPKPDIDNYVKSVLDALNAQAWDDDEQVVALEATKEWAPPGEPGSITIHIKRYSE